MTIEKGKIVQVTDKELFNYWLKNWSELYDYTTYKRMMINKGGKDS